jgi:3-oxoacyl-[acyl-carrier protein] reductase
MDLGLRGRTAVVTAGSRGFGLATALRLAEEGARVALCARGEEDLAAAAAAVAERAGSDDRVCYRTVDVTDDAAVTDFLDHAAEVLGPVDLLLVNAGGPVAGRFLEIDLAQWEAAYRLTIESAVRLCRRVVPGMVERRFGRIVAITSVSVRQPVENLLLSSALRPAVQGLVKSLAEEVAPAGVTVNAVQPGFHLTSAVERLIARKIETTGCSRQDVLDQWTGEIPLGRLGEADELAALIVFLMSGPAGYITGQGINADGGWVRGTF